MSIYLLKQLEVNFLSLEMILISLSMYTAVRKTLSHEIEYVKIHVAPSMPQKPPDNG